MIERAEAWLHLSPEAWVTLLLILAPIAVMLAVLHEIGRALLRRT